MADESQPKSGNENKNENDGEAYELVSDDDSTSESASSAAAGVPNADGEGDGVGDVGNVVGGDVGGAGAELDAELEAKKAAEAAHKRHDDAITDGQVVAVLCYVLGVFCFPFWMVPIVTRDNFFSLYHAKQAMLLWIGLFVVSVITVATCVPYMVLTMVWVAVLLLNAIGVANVNKRLIEPLPLVGGWAEEWFAGIRGV